MKNLETIDSENQPSKRKELWTIRLLLLSALLIAFTIAVYASDGAFSIPHRSIALIPPISILIAFVSSLGGFIVGFYECKKNKRQALFGIIGNLIILIFYLISLITLVNFFQEMGSH